MQLTPKKSSGQKTGGYGIRRDQDVNTMPETDNADKVVASDCRAQFGLPSTRRGCRMHLCDSTVAGHGAERRCTITLFANISQMRYPLSP